MEAFEGAAVEYTSDGEISEQMSATVINSLRKLGKRKINILLMGRGSSGKTSMRPIIFDCYKPIETRRLCATDQVEMTHVQFFKNILLNIKDCGGAMDGKHISIVPSSGKGSEFFNYKGRHSMGLLIICLIMCIQDDSPNGPLLIFFIKSKTKYSKSYLGFGIQSQQLLIIDKIQFDTYFLVVTTDITQSQNVQNYDSIAAHSQKSTAIFHYSCFSISFDMKQYFIEECISVQFLYWHLEFIKILPGEKK
ncbi:hypothetical protein QTP88_007370 [Uroleucon formosanum]